MRLAGATLVFFVAMGMTFPVLPRYVRDELGAGDLAVGVVLGAMAIGAIVARPVLGHIGDRRGRAVLLVGGGLLSAAAMLLHLVAGSVALVFAARLVFGVGQGATIVGATTLAVDMAPSDRSGEATSYIFVALHLGSGIGALVGEWLLRTSGFNAVWVVAAIAMTSSAVASLSVRDVAEPDLSMAVRSGPLLHPTAILPGVILGLGALGFIGFNAFIPLFGDEIGVENAAPFFFAASITIVAIRFFGARLPDRLGPVRGASIALSLSAVGLATIGFSTSALVLGIGTVVLAAGQALCLPSLVPAAVEGVPATERSRAMATYTLFLEISAAAGAFLFGGIAAVSSYGAAYVVSAGFGLVALVLLRQTLGRRRTRPISV